MGKVFSRIVQVPEDSHNPTSSYRRGPEDIDSTLYGDRRKEIPPGLRQNTWARMLERSRKGRWNHIRGSGRRSSCGHSKRGLLDANGLPLDYPYPPNQFYRDDSWKSRPWRGKAGPNWQSNRKLQIHQARALPPPSQEFVHGRRIATRALPPCVRFGQQLEPENATGKALEEPENGYMSPVFREDHAHRQGFVNYDRENRDGIRVQRQRLNSRRLRALAESENLRRPPNLVPALRSPSPTPSPTSSIAEDPRFKPQPPLIPPRTNETMKDENHSDSSVISHKGSPSTASSVRDPDVDSEYEYVDTRLRFRTEQRKRGLRPDWSRRIQGKVLQHPGLGLGWGGKRKSDTESAGTVDERDAGPRGGGGPEKDNQRIPQASWR